MTWRNHIFLIVMLALNSGNICSQALTNRQRRIINLEIYSLLEDYTRYGKLSSNYNTVDETYLQQFAALFKPNATIFNDILPYNRLDHNVSLSEYISLISHYYQAGISFRLHGIQISIPREYAENRYTTDVHLYKEIYGVTSQNANYKDTLSLVFNIEFELKDSRPVHFRISQINGKPAGRTLRLMIRDKKSGEPLENVQVIFNNQYHHTNSSGRLEFKDLDPNRSYSYIIEDKEHTYIRQNHFYVDNLLNSRIEPDPDAAYFDPNEVIYSLRMPARFSASLNVAPSFTGSKFLFSGFSWESNDENKEEAVSSVGFERVWDIHFGFRVGYRFFSSGNYDITGLGGVEYARYTCKSYIEDYVRTWRDFDSDLDPCIKQIVINEATQEIQTQGLSIPFHIQIKYKGFKSFHLSIETGVNLNFFLNNSYFPSVTGSISGLYEQYGNQMIEDDPILGFSDYPGEIPDPASWKERDIPGFYISPTISKNLTKSLELYGGPAFLFGMGNLSVEHDPKPLSEDFETINPMTEVAGQTRIRTINFELGIRYRFADLSGLKNFPF